MKKRRIIVTLSIAFVVIFTFPGFSQEDWPPELDPYYDLNLTSEQISQIQKLELEFHKKILPLETKLDTLYLELRSLDVDGASQAKIAAKLDQIDKKHLELDKKFMEHDARIRGLLTEEQRELYDWYAEPVIDPRGLRGAAYSRRYDRGYSREAGRGYGWRFDRGRGYGRGYRSAFWGGYGRYYGRGYGRAYDRGYDYGRGDGRGLARGFRRYYGGGYGYGRGPGMGRGWRCPYYRRGRSDW